MNGYEGQDVSGDAIVDAGDFVEPLLDLRLLVPFGNVQGSKNGIARIFATSTVPIGNANRQVNEQVTSHLPKQ